MTIMMGIVILMITLLLIAYPLFASQEEEWIDSEESTVAPERVLEMEKEKIFSELNDVELEYSTGKLSDEDYRVLKEQLSRKAVGFLKTDHQSKERTLTQIQTEIEAMLEEAGERE